MPFLIIFFKQISAKKDAIDKILDTSPPNWDDNFGWGEIEEVKVTHFTLSSDVLHESVVAKENSIQNKWVRMKVKIVSFRFEL